MEDLPRAWEPHILHTSVATGLLFASAKPTVYSRPAGTEACSGGCIVRHYQDNAAIWGTEGSPARLFNAEQTPIHICMTAVT